MPTGSLTEMKEPAPAAFLSFLRRPPKIDGLPGGRAVQQEAEELRVQGVFVPAPVGVHQVRGVYVAPRRNYPVHAAAAAVAERFAPPPRGDSAAPWWGGW